MCACQRPRMQGYDRRASTMAENARHPEKCQRGAAAANHARASKRPPQELRWQLCARVAGYARARGRRAARPGRGRPRASKGFVCLQRRNRGARSMQGLLVKQAGPSSHGWRRRSARRKPSSLHSGARGFPLLWGPPGRARCPRPGPARPDGGAWRGRGQGGRTQSRFKRSQTWARRAQGGGAFSAPLRALDAARPPLKTAYAHERGAGAGR